MIKKIITLCLGLVLAQGLLAQDNNKSHRTENSGAGIYNNAKNISFSASDIELWCGTGSNQAVIVVAWDDYTTPTAYAWGVRWNGNVVAIDLIDSIATHDSRFTYQFGGGLISNVEYSEGGVTLASPTNYWCYYVNGNWASGYGNQTVTNGDYLEMSGTCMFNMTSATAASDPNAPQATDATIAASDILYWVGSGSNEVIMAVNWNDPDTALAWGFRFNGDSVSLKQVMDSIDANDHRFHYVAGAWGVDDIRYSDNGDTLALSTAASGYNYWWSNLNGVAASYAYDQLMLSNGDFVKWGDPECGIVLDTMWGYPSEIVWTTTVEPVTIPNDVTVGPFCGAVGTEGCTAIEYSDSRFVGWATGCEVERGYTDIATQSGRVSYGEANDAVGPVDNNNLNVVSLGDGGMATLTFERPIVNGEGYDFAVFENSFNDSFLELGFVEVSSDGEHFVRFAATSLTPTSSQVGTYGSVDPTFINNLAGKYRCGWGTPFDLEELRDSANINIDSIVYVRIIDVVGSIDPQYGSYDAFGHMVNDPYPTDGYSGGFDLDGVGVIHMAASNSDIVMSAEMSVSIYPNPARESVVCKVSHAGSHHMAIYDMTGRLVKETKFEGAETRIDLGQMGNGVYVVRIDGTTTKLTVRH